jgi:hypothetical protein
MESPIVFLRDYGSALGGAVFIGLALGSDRVSKVLRKPLFTFLGNYHLTRQHEKALERTVS